MVKYGYIAYGEISSTLGSKAPTIGKYNPFRWKGYYYDRETGQYLVTSRYYNPEWCRFLNADSIEYLDPSSINGMNLFAYCYNDPVNYVDPSGCFPILSLILCGVALIEMGLTIGVATLTGVVGGVITVAGLGTGLFTSSFRYSFNIKSVDKIGKLIPSNHPREGYWGIRFKNARGSLQSLELQNHIPHGVHFQLNSWNPMHLSVNTLRRWTWFLTRM